MSSAAKTVLLSYLEKNKRIVIPSEKSESDLRYLNNQFIAHFNFESNVKLDITFQRFESEWNEYIDLEDTDEINDKDKLKVVVTPLLGGETPTRCISGSFKDKDEDKENSDSTVGSRRRLPSVGESSNSSLVIGHDDSSVTLTDDVQDESCEEDLILTSSKRCRMALASDESDSDVTEGIEQNSESKDMQCKSKYVLKDMPKAVYKTEQDAIPLPDPFELPKHYRPDVEVALKSGKMTVDTNKSFLSTVAAAMFTYKRYPTADDYNNVARVIIHQYPFMKSPTGKPHGAIVKGLIGRFKERRRNKKPRKTPSHPLKVEEPMVTVKRKLKAFDLPPIPPGEDETSFERHNRVLKTEYNKANPNVSTVKELMKVTFPMRRQDILSHGHTYDPLQKYPYLQQPSHMLDELQCITCDANIVESARQAWKEYVLKIIKQARMERGTRVMQAVSFYWMMKKMKETM